MFAGSLQMLTGAVGFAKSLRVPKKSEHATVKAYAIQGMCFANYLSVVALQVLTQIALAPGTTGSQFAVSLPCNHIAFFITVAFLEWKIKTVRSCRQCNSEEDSIKEDKV
jgi:hypothetical protein